jgi:fermentation-respiration switch protein FrsA (DUF1100 family)
LGYLPGILAALVALAGCRMMALDRLVFFPDPYVPDPPPGVVERWITTADGVRIHAWFAGVPGAPATLVWAHGNGGNIGDRGDVLLALAAHGVSVLAFDYRGYGKSEGEPSEEGVYLDAEAAYDSERARGVPPEQIVLFGESLGGAVMTYLATTRPCAGLAMVSTFTSLGAVARRHYGPIAALAGNRFDSLSRIRGIHVPLFMAHGDQDEIVPFDLGEALFRAANEPKHFLRAPGFRHNDVFAAPGLIEAIAAFARDVAGKATKAG